MVTIKNQLAKNFLLLASITLIFTGCGPTGPRMLLSGKKLLEKGKYAEAVEKLSEATSILMTNAQAWNYLGLAYHGLGQSSNAVQAYQQALALDRNLVETRYNLGCLYLEQNKLDAAKNELTTFVLRRPNSTGAFVKLGTAQLRGKELNAAEKSFSDALHINPQSAEGFSGIGLVMMQRNRPRDAAQYFEAALKQQPNYAPAALNLAVVAQQLNDKQTALQKYREYVALEPNSANAASVSEIIRQLDRELNPPKPTSVLRPPVIAAQPTNVVKVTGNKPPAGAAKVEARTNAISKPEIKNILQPTVVVKPDSKTEPAAHVPAITSPKNTEVEIVKVPEPVIVKSAPSLPAANSTSPPEVIIIEPPSLPASSSQLSSSNTASAGAGKSGFLTAINPKTWFQRPQRSLTSPKMTPIQNSTPAITTKTNVPKQPPTFARYPYRVSIKLKSGDRRQAEAPFAQGLQAQQDGKFSEAVTAFKSAVKSDPAFFQAHYNLGWAAFQSGDLSQALASYENALSLDSSSADTRYNFALALKQANYFPDSANELEKLLAKHPDDARAHLLLGNLCAEQFDKPQFARAHYLRVLEIEPKHPRAGDIRFWLAAHP